MLRKLVYAEMVVSETKPSFFRQKLELLLLAEDQETLAPVTELVARNHISFRHVSSLQNLKTFESQFGRPQILLIVQGKKETLAEFSAKIDELLQVFRRSSIVTVLQDSSVTKALEGTMNPRVFPLTQREFRETAKLEYICLARTRSLYFDITLKDLYPMTMIPFTAYVRMTLNQRYLAVIFRKVLLQEGKYQRLEAVSALHVTYDDVDPFVSYVKEFNDTSGNGLKRRVRALFLGVVSKTMALNNYLIFDLRTLEEPEVQILYNNLEEAAKDLLEVLALGDDTWDVLREASSNELFGFWRAPWVGVYAAMICAKSGQGNALNALMAGLLTDVGLLDISREVYRAYLSQGAEALVESEDFITHPMASLNRCLAKKLPLSEELKTLIVCTHEQANQKGFPNQVPADKIPVEAMAIQFAEIIDYGVRTTLKDTGVSFRFLKEKIWEKEEGRKEAFSAQFLAWISEALL
ncbi:hypothetical protein D3C87_188990 [compost metagenome]